MRKLSAKWVPKFLNADQTPQRCHRLNNIGNILAWSKWFSVAIGDHGRNLVISLRPKNKATISGVAAKGLTQPQNFPSAKIRWKYFLLDVFGIKTASSSLSIFQRTKLWTRSITHLCWWNWMTFWRKNSAGNSPRGLDLARQCPGSPGTCNPEETVLSRLPMSWSPTLFSGPVPVGLPPVLWTEKYWNFVIFRPTRRSLLLRWPGWTDKFLWFF